MRVTAHDASATVQWPFHPSMCRPQSATVFLVGVLASNFIPIVTSSATEAGSFLQVQESRANLDKSESESDAYLNNMVMAGAPSQADNVHYLMRTLKKFGTFAKESEAGVNTRHTAEATRLQAAVTQTDDSLTKFALEQSIKSNAETLLETQRVYKNMINFADSMETFLAQATTGQSCEKLQCGEHASCTDTISGAQCICHEGYVGAGKDCKAPPEFMPHHLLFEPTGAEQTQARDINVALFGKNSVAVVFVDVSRGGMGRSIVGNVQGDGLAVLSPPEAFTWAGSEAIDPVVTGTQNQRLLVTWRDKKTGGNCWMRGASLGVTNIRGANQKMTWGEPVNFCQQQSHKMAAVPLPNDRIVVLFADQVKGTEHTPAESFGNSALLEVGKNGAVKSFGNFRFSDYAMCRLEVTKLTPKTFVVAGRAAKATDDMDSSVHTNQEAIALLGEMSGDDLVFDPNYVNLEPKSTDIWARGISLIAPNTFAYAYQRGKELQMMLAVVQVDEKTRKMTVVHQPSPIVKNGFSPYVSMISVPYTAADPHTLTYYNGADTSLVNMCSWDATNHSLQKCEEFTWLKEKVKSVSGVHLGGGKSFMVFAPESGVPYWGVFGLSKRDRTA